MKFQYDICVIGLGRIGLPLALSFDNVGLSVFGIDINEDVIRRLVYENMPFKEKGCAELLRKSKIKFYSKYDGFISRCKNIIVCVGTPIHKNREIDFSFLKNVLDNIIPKMVDGQNIIFRSTIKPGLMNKILDYIEIKTNKKCGVDFYLSYAFERLVEGDALKEIETLPQIIGCQDDQSFQKSSILFSKIVKTEILKTDFITAELIKVFSNMSRYANFGIVNYLAAIAFKYDCDINNIIDICNFNYPRPILHKPGLAAGPCLVKDFRMIDEDLPYSNLFCAIDEVNQTYFLAYLNDAIFALPNNSIIGILGYSFKKDSDDIRESLSSNIIRFFENNLFDNIMINDYNIIKNDIPENHKKYWAKEEDIINNSDLVVIAVNHTKYKNLDFNDVGIVVDIWNVLKKNEIIQYNE